MPAMTTKEVSAWFITGGTDQGTTKEVSAWFITGGTDQGVMKYIGEAREVHAIYVPLIVIASYGRGQRWTEGPHMGSRMVAAVEPTRHI
ncbi:hypothetical protein T484DRAFT_1849740 [Baffinella frigidus]|nr:hypothetical protein T484DRAFT_1849740 [Cryptophyta sp. CCMP2293]